MMTTKVSNRLTNANGIGESFPNVSVFTILIFEVIISIGAPPRFGKAPNSMAFKILVWEVGQDYTNKFILERFLPL